MKRFWQSLWLVVLAMLLSHSSFAQTGPTRIGSQLTFDAAGKITLFSRSFNDHLYVQYRHNMDAPNPQAWTYPEDLGGVIKGNPTALYDWDGAMLVIARGTDDTLFFRKETSRGSRVYTWWGQIPDSFVGGGGDVPYFYGDPALLRGSDGRLSLYIAAVDGAVWTSSQVSPGKEFNGWTSLGKHHESVFAGSGVVAALNNDGRPLVAYTGVDGRAYLRHQNSDGSWQDWQDLGGNFPDAYQRTLLAFERQANNRLSLFGTMMDQTIQAVSQSNVGSKSWTAWQTVRTGVNGYGVKPTVIPQEDRRLLLFFWSNGNNDLKWQYQTKASQNSWKGWQTLWNPVYESPLAITDSHGSVHVFALDQWNVWHEMVQTELNGNEWTDWWIGNLNPT